MDIDYFAPLACNGVSSDLIESGLVWRFEEGVLAVNSRQLVSEFFCCCLALDIIIFRQSFQDIWNNATLGLHDGHLNFEFFAEALNDAQAEPSCL